ncbi:hypothetical protein BCR42DRAFT_426100 [Absidia repens]|uniref:Uncharacterized protein n=1 Tax=Absidia repens TaxID=90262 RepID=A0A1X2I1C8_9FUNG|nr:hypothetical protein BCR42DRAFT_426100 [Absidia repens]
MPMSMFFVLFFSLWVAIVSAQDYGSTLEVTITYKPTVESGIHAEQQYDEKDGKFGQCFPTASSGSGHVVTGIRASVPAICVQYELADCKGKVLDQKFEFQSFVESPSINLATAKSLVCIPKYQK